jgi:hypothetical protein
VRFRCFIIEVLDITYKGKGNYEWKEKRIEKGGKLFWVTMRFYFYLVTVSGSRGKSPDGIDTTSG